MSVYQIPAGRYGDTSTAFIQAYIDQKISAVIDGSPETLNTLNELAQAIGDDADVLGTLQASIQAVQDDVNANETAAANLVSALETARGLITDALAARLDTLELDPTTATAVATVQSDVDSVEAAAATARGLLSNRLDTLETDPVTQTYVDGINTALDGRLGTLEADPTTATAVAAVQSELDTEESTRATNDAALSVRIDTLEADPTTQTAVDAKLDTANPAATGELTVDTNAKLEFDSNLTKLRNYLRGTRIDVGNNITLYPAAAGGRVEVEGEFYLRPSDLTDAADDTAAAAAGIIVGQVYRNGSQLMVRVS